MKNLLISAVVAIIVLFSLVRSVSAEPTFEKADNVVKVIMKNMKTGWRESFPSGPEQLKKGITTLLKPCVTENGAHRTCLYEVKGKKETFLYDYTASDDICIIYWFETQVTTIAGR